MTMSRQAHIDYEAKIKYFVEKVDGDGLCQYHAIARAMRKCGVDVTVYDVINALYEHVDSATSEDIELLWICNDKYLISDDFDNFSVEEKRDQIQLDLLEKEYWGNQYTLQFFANHFKVTFFVFQRYCGRLTLCTTVGCAPRGVPLLFEKQHYDLLSASQYDKTLMHKLYDMSSVDPMFFDNW